MGRSFSPIRGLKSNWSIIVPPVTRHPFPPPKNRNSHIEENRYFLKRTKLLFRYFSFISCSLSKSSQCSVQDLTQQEHLHIFAQIFATFLTRSFFAGMFDGQYNIIYNTYCVTQLKLDTVEKLSSTIFCCLSVRHRCHPTKSPLFPIYTGIRALC